MDPTLRRLTSWRDFPISRKGLIVIAIPVIPLVFTAAMYFQSERAYAEAELNTERAWRLRAGDLSLQARLFEAESGLRAYVLLGDERFLTALKGLQADASALLDELESQTFDAQQRDTLPRLRGLVVARLDAMEAAIGAARGGRSASEVAARLQHGAAVMDALRLELEHVLARNTVLITERTSRRERLHGQLNTIIMLGTIAGVLGGVVGARLFTTGVARRLAAASTNVSRLANGEPVIAADPAADEIGTLTAATERAGRLLASRDAQLRERMTELESLTRELEAFSYSVSHDLRAPLRHVVGFAALLQKSARDTLTTQQQRYTATIVEAAARMGRLIDDLLAFSRTGRAELRRSSVDLTAIVRDVHQEVMADAEGRRVRWTLHPLPPVAGDPAMLRVVFDNLLANAIKYTRPRDEAEIEVGSQTGEQGDAIVFVRDNGVGFDMKYQHKLFGVFQRLHTSDEFEGTGIGLATVRRIIARHGGRAWAEGRVGEGATFYVSLPREQTAS